jgi:phosphatidylglycerophosphate synthase
MNLGLYQMKYPFRRMIGGLLRLACRTRPDTISWSCLPIGAATAVVYYFSARAPLLYGLGIALIILRMIVTTLDGLLAESTGQSCPHGELVNRIPAKISDVLLLVAVAAAAQMPAALVAMAVGACWLASYASLMGPLAGVPGHSTGPAGQTDRLAATLIASAWGLAGTMGVPAELGGLSPLQWLLVWFAAGGVLTFLLRIRLALRDARRADPAVWRAIKQGQALQGRPRP